MFKTSNSHWPVAYWAMTEVKEEQPETVSVMAEIDLYLAGVARMWTWLFYVYQCMGPQDGQLSPLWQRHVGRFTNLRTSWINNLPDAYKLKQNIGSTRYYRTYYVSGSALPEGRPVVLTNVDGLLHCMRACEAELQKDPDLDALMKSTSRQNLQDAELIFGQWMQTARPHFIPSQDELQRRQEEGRGHGRPRTAPARNGSRAHISLLLTRLREHSHT